MRIPIALLPFLLLSKLSPAQISIGYFPFQSEILIATNSERLIWGDFRVATNPFYGHITTEPVLMVNVKRAEWANFYGGIGTNLNFFNAASNISVVNGYSVHLGTRAKPLKRLTRLHVIFEISPYVNRNFDGGLLRTRIGLAYLFLRREKSP